MWRSHDNKIVPDYANAIVWIKRLFAAKAPGSGKVYGGTSGSDLETAANWKSNLFLNPAVAAAIEPTPVIRTTDRNGYTRATICQIIPMYAPDRFSCGSHSRVQE